MDPELYDDIGVVKRMKIQRLCWLDHVERMDNNALAKKVLFSKCTDGTRKKERPH